MVVAEVGDTRVCFNLAHLSFHTLMFLSQPRAEEDTEAEAEADMAAAAGTLAVEDTLVEVIPLVVEADTVVAGAERTILDMVVATVAKVGQVFSILIL
jgi:hypothetical protein